MNKKIKEWEQANSSFNYNEVFVYKQIRRAKINVFFTKTLQLCTCVFALIFVLVNTSPAYIKATKDIPLLNKLNEILNFNPSVNSAIKNDYIQTVNVIKEKDGLLVEVDQVIVDEKEIYVFYNITYNGKKLKKYDYTIDVPDVKKGPAAWDHYEQGEYHVSNYLMNDTSEVIDNYTLEYRYEDIRLKVNIPIDKNRIAKHKTYNTNQIINIEGQKLIIEKVEVYPLATRIYVKEDKNNTDTIQHFKFNLTVNGEPIEQKSLVMLNDVYYLESPYFIEDNYEITLESVMLTPKDATSTLNLGTGEYIDPTGLTSLVEFSKNNEFEFEGMNLNAKLILECKTEDALSRAYFMHYPSVADYSNTVTYEASFSEDISTVFNTFRFYLEDGISDSIDLKINTGETIEVNKQLELK